MLLTTLALLGCSAPDVPHPGTVTYRRNGVVQSIERVENVPERMRFYEDGGKSSRRPRRVPITEVEARDIGPGQMEILEYGPGPVLLRTTLGQPNPAAR